MTRDQIKEIVQEIGLPANFTATIIPEMPTSESEFTISLQITHTGTLVIPEYRLGERGAQEEHLRNRYPWLLKECKKAFLIAIANIDEIVGVD